MSDDEELAVNGGLQISKLSLVGGGESKHQEIHTRWETLPTVLEQFDEWGLPTDPREPKVECPVVTAEMLLTPDAASYTAMFANQRLWFNYAARRLSRIKVELLQTQTEMKDLARQSRQDCREINKTRKKIDRMTAEEINDVVETVPRYRELRVRELALLQFKTLASDIVEELESAMKLISRQVELRREDSRSGTNEQNMPGRANGRFSGIRPGP
jgi:hypothetical protein